MDRKVSRQITGVRAAVIAAGALLLALTGGCGVAQLGSPADLDRMVAHSKQPVIVDFYKAGCEHCSAFETTFHGLADRYQGKIVAAKYLLMQADGTSTAPDLATKYEILQYPTVILFVDGQETKRFVQVYKYSSYSDAIDECLASLKAQQAGAKGN